LISFAYNATSKPDPATYSPGVRTSKSGDNLTLKIDYGAEDSSTWLADFTYTDTITIVVSAN